MKTSLLASSTLVLLAIASAACTAGTAPGEDVAESEDALRALTAAEIVGTIGYGQTSGAIPYSEDPTYRALKFEGSKGDEIEIDVHADAADARAWLLAPSFRTLKWNDDASASTRDSHITHKLTQSGTHYIAFREKNYEDTSITVTLKKKNATPPPPPPPPPVAGDPFEPSYCSGPAITQAQAVSRFPAGGTSAQLGRFQVVSRSRTCNQVTGCTAWTQDANLAFWVSGSPSNHVWSMPSPQNGSIRLDVVNGALRLTLQTDDQGNGQNAPKNHRLTFDEFVGRDMKLKEQWGFWASWGWPMWEGPENSSVFERSGILTNDCLRWSVKAKKNTATGHWTEHEYAYFGRF